VFAALHRQLINPAKAWPNVTFIWCRDAVSATFLD
jgi:hypothetical protein